MLQLGKQTQEWVGQSVGCGPLVAWVPVPLPALSICALGPPLCWAGLKVRVRVRVCVCVCVSVCLSPRAWPSPWHLCTQANGQ